MLREIPLTDCTQARQAVSARADGELSELESGRLEAHLHDCAACTAYARSVEALALGLRGAELEQPSRPVFSAPHRRRSAFRVNSAAAAAALLVAAASAFAVGHVVGSKTGSEPAKLGKLSPVSLQRAEVLGMVRRLRPGRMSADDVIAV
jgi:predicted anti-sigma-YlaC factor YlaD